MSYESYDEQHPDTFSFYRNPKSFYKDKEFKELSSDAKLLYGIMLDRLNISLENDWIDEDGKLYIYMTIENIESMMKCSRQKAVSIIKELNDIGLIEKKKQGLHKPSKIYVKNLE